MLPAHLALSTTGRSARGASRSRLALTRKGGFRRPLRDGVYELRPTLNGEATRVTYWFAPDRRIVLLTVFRKTRMRESAQVDRAVRARELCEAEHSPAHTTYTRGESR
ncbi:type II toxin-antitoxin system RelE/ParE family toxin [Streptomyces parvus]|uniref:type II toxin-antitoxin system RelE/ParE family toxin n=1 Tax=Streptomyces parvus TaxID=66428 RepID=UPI0034331127